jgi:hypothetical protein
LAELPSFCDCATGTHPRAVERSLGGRSRSLGNRWSGRIDFRCLLVPACNSAGATGSASARLRSKACTLRANLAFQLATLPRRSAAWGASRESRRTLGFPLGFSQGVSVSPTTGISARCGVCKVL